MILKQKLNKKFETIDRLPMAFPKDKKRFYLRLLLHRVKGATCFEDIRSFNNVVYTSLQEAAKHRGLLEDDEEWDQCLKEAIISYMPSKIKLIFSIIILIFISLSDPLKLGNSYRDSMSKDYKHKNFIDIYSAALFDIEKLLSDHGVSLTSFGLSKLTLISGIDENNIIDIEYAISDADKFSFD